MFIAYNNKNNKICPHAQKQRATWIVIKREV